MFAGRNASFTHVGLGSPRVMATCGVAGQAAGVTAAIAARRGESPREIRNHQLDTVQQTLLRQGAFVIRRRNQDPDDLAMQARVRASSESPLVVAETPEDGTSFEHRLFQLFPISGGDLDRVDVLVEADQPCRFSAGLRQATDIWDFSSADDLAQSRAVSAGGGREWLSFPFGLHDLEPGLYWLWIDADPSCHARWLGAPTGPVGLVRGVWERGSCRCPDLAPRYRTLRGTSIFRLSPRSHPYGACNVANGVPEARVFEARVYGESLKEGQA